MYILDLKEKLGEELYKEVMENFVAKTEYDKILAENENLKAQVEELIKYKPKEKSDAEKALEEKERALFQKEVELTLKEHGLEDFKDLIKVNSIDELNTTIEGLKKVLDARKLGNSYKPTDHKNTDAYFKYANEKNPVGMIGVKLSKLFQ